MQRVFVLILSILILACSGSQNSILEPENKEPTGLTIRLPESIFDPFYWQGGDSLSPFISIHADTTFWLHFWIPGGYMLATEMNLGEQWIRHEDGWIEIPLEKK